MKVDAKKQARNLRKFLAEQSIDITNSLALEAIARIYDYKDWNTMAASFKGFEQENGKINHLFTPDKTGMSRPVVIDQVLMKAIGSNGSTIICSQDIDNSSTIELIAEACAKNNKQLIVIDPTITYKHKVDFFSLPIEFNIKERLLYFLKKLAYPGCAIDVFTGRSITLLSALLTVLVWQRDNDPSFQLTLRKILEHLPLNKVVDLVNLGRSGKIPYEIYSPLEEYFKSIPGYNKDEEDNLGDEISEQHGYIFFQLTEGFNNLIHQYCFFEGKTLKKLLKKKNDAIFLINEPSKDIDGTIPLIRNFIETFLT